MHWPTATQAFFLLQPMVDFVSRGIKFVVPLMPASQAHVLWSRQWDCKYPSLYVHDLNFHPQFRLTTAQVLSSAAQEATCKVTGNEVKERQKNLQDKISIHYFVYKAMICISGITQQIFDDPPKFCNKVILASEDFHIKLCQCSMLVWPLVTTGAGS